MILTRFVVYDDQNAANVSYFELRYLFEDRVRYLIWSSTHVGRADGVLKDASDHVLAFGTRQYLVSYARKCGIELTAEQPILHNLDIVRIWLKRKKSERVDCQAFLAAWNLFSDVASSIGATYEGDRKHANPLYQKLFCGNNLPALTPSGKRYIPLWSRQEHRLMRSILAEGIALFRSTIRFQESIAPD